MKTSELLFFIAFGAVVTFVVTMTLRDWLRKRRTIRMLKSRELYDDNQFCRLFAGLHQPDIAVRARRVLANNLNMPLDGLAPSDRLNDDLNAELPANPDLFWELEAEFDIKTDVEDLDSHEKTLERLVTFQDLVEYVEHRIAEQAPEPSVTNEDGKSSHTFDLAIRSIPVLCIGGFLTAVVGIIAQKPTLINLGGLAFTFGIAVWGFANGGEMLRNIFKSSRGSTWKEISARPWPLILLTGVAVFFLWIGGTLVWEILKNALSSG
jgi:acyl carrier protein